eukprot:1857146-Prymnesium_polylepis.1
MPASQPPRITWWQRKASLSLAFSCPNSGSAPSGEPTLDVDATSVSFAWDAFAFSGTLLKPVDKASAKWERTGSNKQTVQLTVRKAERGPHWRSPFTGPKLPYVAPDWDRWVEEDEEPPEEPEPAPAPQEAATAAGDEPDIADMAALQLEGDGRDAWEAGWKALSMPQRMVTMAECWNALAEDTRAMSAKRV